MKRKLEGERKSGGRGGGAHAKNGNEKGWTRKKTGEDLNISEDSVYRAISITKAVEEYPELAGDKKGTVILRKYKRKKDEKRIGKEAPLKQIQVEPKSLYINPYRVIVIPLLIIIGLNLAIKRIKKGGSNGKTNYSP